MTLKPSHLYRRLRSKLPTSKRGRIGLGFGIVVLVGLIAFGVTQSLQGSKTVSVRQPTQSQPKKKVAVTPKATAKSTPDTTIPTTPAITAPAVVKSYNYCVAVDGVDASNLPEFSAKLASVYADSRGWSLGGQISFTKVDSDCSLKVWLAAADRVPSYGAICDNVWSCTVHPNVIINFDRWSGASDAWNAAGGTLDDYRSMVINHETGHWFGFQHKYCAGAGQPAPVMQQQSISLQGCAMNSWPLDSEKTQLRSYLGI